MGEPSRESWQPIAVLGGGGPRRLDEGGLAESPGALPPPPVDVAAQQAALELERRRLELDRERLALERERLELERARLLAQPPPLPGATAAPQPVPPPAVAPAAIGAPVSDPPAAAAAPPSTSSSGRRPRTTRLASRPATPGTPQGHVAIAIVVLSGVVAGGLVVLLTGQEPAPAAAVAPPVAGPEPWDRATDREERRAAATRAAEAELAGARRAQQAAQRDAARRAKALDAEEAAARAAARARLKAEAEALRQTLEQGAPRAFAAAVTRLGAIGKERAADQEVARAAEHALRDVEDLRARCQARAITAANRLADDGDFAAAAARLDEAKGLGLPLPASATDEAARWPARAKARAEAAARSDAEQRRVAAAREAVLDEALGRARAFYEARRAESIRCGACAGGGCGGCTRGIVAQSAAAVCAMLAPTAQQETGDWSSWSPGWPEAARGLLGPSLAIRGATTTDAVVHADRVVTTTTVTWATRPESTSEHVLVWVRERPGAKLVVRGAEPPPVTVPLY